MAAAARRRGAAGGYRGPRKPSRGGVGVRACGGRVGGRRRSDSRGEVKALFRRNFLFDFAILLHFCWFVVNIV